MKTKFAFVFVVLAMVIAACGAPATPAPEPTPMPEPTAEPEMPKTIVDIAAEDGRFDTLVTAVQAADLAGTLSSEGPFTVFAPTDDAFAALPEGTLEALLADIPALTDILLYHVVAGEVTASDVVSLDGQSAETALEGKTVAIKVDADRVILNENVNVIITDIQASNGVIHVVDAVLLPPADEEAMSEDMSDKMDIVDTAVADGRFNTLVAAVQAAGLADALKGEGPFTVFAPTDDAFAALPEGTIDALLADIPTLSDILLYHVVEGKVMAADVVELSNAMTLNGQYVDIAVEDGKVMVDGAEVILTDIETSNGVIHVIDAVILPESRDIVDIAVEDGRFTTLVAAVQAADLVDTLKGEGPFTVFAPTDEAFAALPAGTIDALLADIPALTDILLYHVVPGKVMAADVVGLDGQSAGTALEGQSIDIKIDMGNVYLNEDVQVIITDIEASNGVIHVIDAVLLPPQ
jgi:uncharacterized surface protein with fasciclin (FAS1) repeats